MTVKKDDDFLTMDFPSFTLTPIKVIDKFAEAIGVKPIEAYMGDDLVFVLESEEQVKNVVPNLSVINELEGTCLHITAKGTDFDCVTRSFVPKCNVAEDPVCGRGHCHVIPLWAEKLGKNKLIAYQASLRGGILKCTYKGKRTVLSGQAVLFAESKIYF